jgi:peroxiredoxin
MFDAPLDAGRRMGDTIEAAMLGKTDSILRGTALVLLLALCAVVADTMGDHVVKVGDRAPHFSIVTETGKTLTRENFGGKLLVLNFWATWCPPCVEEMPSLNRFHQELKDAGVVVLAVSVDKKQEAVKTFAQRYGLDFEIAWDGAGDVPATYGTFKYPETYVINAKGEVLEKFIGEENWADPRLIERIRRLL